MSMYIFKCIFLNMIFVILKKPNKKQLQFKFNFLSE